MPESSKWEGPNFKMRVVERVFSLAIYLSRFSHPHFDFDFVLVVLYSNGLWKCVGQLPNAHLATIYSIDYAPAKAGHGRLVSAGADNRIQIYREAMGSTSDKPLFSLETCIETAHGDVNCVCWHPWDGSILCSAGDDGAVRLWRFESC